MNNICSTLNKIHKNGTKMSFGVVNNRRIVGDLSLFLWLSQLQKNHSYRKHVIKGSLKQRITYRQLLVARRFYWKRADQTDGKKNPHVNRTKVEEKQSKQKKCSNTCKCLNVCWTGNRHDAMHWLLFFLIKVKKAQIKCTSLNQHKKTKK